MNDTRIPFTMQARLVQGTEAAPDAEAVSVPSDWIRIPVTVQVTIPAETLRQARGEGRS